MRLIFAIPGDLTSFTGGYCYGRKVMACLPEHKIDVIHCQLPGSFPNPASEDIQEAVRAVNAVFSQGDIALIDGLAYGTLPEAAIAAIEAPIVALCHHPLGLEAGLEPWRSRALLASEKAALALAAGVIVTSPFTARTLEKQFGVPLGRIFVARPGTEPAHRAVGSGGPPLLLALGSIIPRKGYNVLIEALYLLSDLDWRLYIVGSPHQSPETSFALERLIGSCGLDSRVKCLGGLESAALNEVLHRSDIFVSPSLYEGYGMALAEAMARGFPIVTTTAGAAAETVPNEAALKCPSGDIVALSEALRRVILDEELRKRLSEGSWLAGQKLPSWRDTAKKIARVVNDIAMVSE